MQQKGHALSQSGNIVLAPLIILLVLAGVVFFLISKKPAPQLKTEYKNPFQKESQYVNPFDSYKNPFDTIRANE